MKDATPLNLSTRVCEDGRLEGFARYLDHHPMPTWVFELDSLRIVDVNRAAIERYGYSFDEFRSMTLRDLRPASTMHLLDKAIIERRQPFKTDGRMVVNGFHHTRDGELLHVAVMTYPYSAEKPSLIVASCFDITEQQKLQDDLQRQTAYFRQLFENSPDGIVLLDTEERVIDLNCAFERMFGHTVDEALGRNINDLLVPEGDMESARHFSHEAREGMSRRDGIKRIRKDGSVLHVDIRGYPIINGSECEGIYAIYRDVSDKQEVLKELQFRAQHDSLTSLLNRRELEARVAKLIEEDPCADRAHAFIYIDLDEFKVINDTSGHLAGDQLLVAVAAALRLAVKGSDAVARLGGDEFGILLYDCDLDSACVVAERVLHAVRNVEIPHRGPVKMGASIGVAAIQESTGDFEQLVSNADAACYAAKAAGKNRIEIYECSKKEIIQRRELGNWAMRLRAALDADRFELDRQKIVPVNSGCGEDIYEVLVRMVDENGERVNPCSFIPAAERLHLMEEIDQWVIDHVLEAMRDDVEKTVYSINISGNSLGRPEFARTVTGKILSSEVDPARLCFEITETSAIARMEVAEEFIKVMKQLGCRIALDDFGSGMSSFTYLKSLPVDILKIDGAFIRDITCTPEDRAITAAFNRIGHAFGMITIAEFVECGKSMEILADIGVDLAQGFHIHRPEPWILVAQPEESINCR